MKKFGMRLMILELLCMAGVLQAATPSATISDERQIPSTVDRYILKETRLSFTLKFAGYGATRKLQYFLDYMKREMWRYCVNIRYSFKGESVVVSIDYPDYMKIAAVMEGRMKRSALNAMDKKTLAVVRSVVSKVVKKDMAPYDKALALHDWLVRHVHYWDGSMSGFPKNAAHQAAQPLIAGRGVCEGIAGAYYLLLRQAGVPAKRVISEEHAWVLVQVDGQWMHVDPTGNDAAGRGGISHKFFGLDDDEMYDEHDMHSGYRTAYPRSTNDELSVKARTGQKISRVDEVHDMLSSRLGSVSGMLSFRVKRGISSSEVDRCLSKCNADTRLPVYVEKWSVSATRPDQLIIWTKRRQVGRRAPAAKFVK